MTDAMALAAARALMVVAVAVVALRQLAPSARARELSTSPWSYIWLLYVADYALMWRHPLVLTTPSAYDGAIRPLGLVLMLAGIVLVAWAYAALGPYWSGDITLRTDHRVIATGPFAFVRHPVYAGYLLGVFGGTLALADPVVAVAALASVPLMRGRALAEERFLEARLGDAYRAYRRRVPMFVPRIG